MLRNHTNNFFVPKSVEEEERRRGEEHVNLAKSHLKNYFVSLTSKLQFEIDEQSNFEFQSLKLKRIHALLICLRIYFFFFFLFLLSFSFTIDRRLLLFLCHSRDVNSSSKSGKGFDFFSGVTLLKRWNFQGVDTRWFLIYFRNFWYFYKFPRGEHSAFGGNFWQFFKILFLKIKTLRTI